MESNRFDVLVRRFVGTGSRRSALHALAGGTLGLLAGGPAMAAADDRRKGGKGGKGSNGKGGAGAGNGHGRGDGKGTGAPTDEADLGPNPGAVAGGAGDGDGPAAAARGSKKGKRGRPGPRGPAGVIGQTVLKTSAPVLINPNDHVANVTARCDAGTRLLSCGYSCSVFTKAVPTSLHPFPTSETCSADFRNDSTTVPANCVVHALCGAS